MTGDALTAKFFELSLDLLCIAGTDGYFKHLNPRWTQVLGWTEEELKSRPFIELVHPDDRDSTIAEAAKLASGNYETVAFENRYLHKNGEWRWLLWTAAVDVEAGVLLSVARDITDRKRSEDELRRAKQLAEDANRAKSRFLANMSHELRTPLNAVIGFANVLLKQGDDFDDKQRNYIERMLANGRHLLALVDDVLDLAKVEAGRLRLDVEQVDALRMTRDVAQQLAGDAEARGVALVATGTAAATPLRADLRRLRQVLINLVGNALKFTDRGGVEIHLANDSAGKPARIDVVDTGIGIPRDQLDAIFESFEQVESGSTRRYEGSGLGLSISMALCREMGFALRVDSVEGRGAIFSVCFAPDAGEVAYRAPDLAVSTGTAVATDSHKATGGPSRDAVVLVIDDDPDSRSILEGIVAEDGYDVVCASSGREGLRLAQSLQPALIMLDVMMPGLDGAKVLRRLKTERETADIPVVVCSIVADDSRTGMPGAAGFLSKPAEADTIKGALHRWISGSSRVLIVEDDPDARELLRVAVEECGDPIVLLADNGRTALDILERQTPDLIVLDLRMPVMNGFEFLTELRKRPAAAAIPIIVVTSEEPLYETHERLHGQVQAVIDKARTSTPAFRSLLLKLLEGRS